METKKHGRLKITFLSIIAALFTCIMASAITMILIDIASAITPPKFTGEPIITTTSPEGTYTVKIYEYENLDDWSYRCELIFNKEKKFSMEICNTYGGGIVLDGHQDVAWEDEDTIILEYGHLNSKYIDVLTESYEGP